MQSQTAEISVYVELRDSLDRDFRILAPAPTVALPVTKLVAVEPTGHTPTWSTRDTLWCDKDNLASRVARLLESQNRTLLIQGDAWTTGNIEGPTKVLMSVH